MKPAIIPAPRRARVRTMFIRSLAQHSTAIRDLLDWRLSPSEYDSERETVLRDFVRRTGRRHIYGGDGNPGGDWWLSSDDLDRDAGNERLNAASMWSTKWHLEAAWIRAWAAYALLRWDVARACSASDCPGHCAAVHRGDDGASLDLVLTNGVMLSLVEEHYPERFEVTVENLGDLDNSDIGLHDPLPPWQRPIVPPIAGPHPVRETRTQYLERTRRAWDAAYKALADERVALTDRRFLEAHCEWLVRYQVLQQTASAILNGRGDPSAVYHAVRSLASLLELSIRS